MSFDASFVKNLRCLKDGYLEYRYEYGKYSYLIGFSSTLFGHSFTIASDIDQTQFDFGIIPESKMFISNDTVLELGGPEEFFSYEGRIEKFQQLKDLIDSKYGLLPVVAVIRQHELNPNKTLQECFTEIYTKYKSAVDAKVQELLSPFA